MPVIEGFTSQNALPVERINDKVSRQVLSGAQGMIVWWKAKAGGHVQAHKHPHEQIFWMLKGRMEFRIAGEKKSCGPGEMAVIPGNVEHEAWFVEDTEVIDVFAPRRDDFLTGEPPPYVTKD